MPIPQDLLDADVLPCLVCGKPVVKGQWWVTANIAVDTVRTGTQMDGPQRPVHVTCVAPFPLRRPNG